MGPRDQFAVPRVDPEVVHRRRRQALHEPPPRASPVEGRVHAHIGPHKEQVLVARILPYHMHEVGRPGGQVRRNGAEGAAPVVGDVDVRREVVRAVAVEGDVHAIGVVARGLHTADVGAVGSIGETTGQLDPLAPVIRRCPDATVIGACEEDSLHERRLGKRRDCGVGLRAGHVGRNAPGRARADFDLPGIGVGEVRRDDLEVVSEIRTLDNPVASSVEVATVVHRLEERRVPVPAHDVAGRICRGARAQFGDPGIVLGRPAIQQQHDAVLQRPPRRLPIRFLQRRALAGRQVDAPHVAALRLGPHQIRILCVLGRDEAVSATDGRPVVFCDLSS